MAKKTRRSPYDLNLEYRTTRELENSIIWCIVILLSAIITEDSLFFLTKMLPLLIAGAAGTILVNAK